MSVVKRFMFAARMNLWMELRPSMQPGCAPALNKLALSSSTEAPHSIIELSGLEQCSFPLLFGAVWYQNELVWPTHVYNDLIVVSQSGCSFLSSYFLPAMRTCNSCFAAALMFCNLLLSVHSVLPATIMHYHCAQVTGHLDSSVLLPIHWS